jgi:hypothetical protein
MMSLSIQLRIGETMKIRTTVYSHKVIDVVRFDAAKATDHDIEELFDDLACNVMESAELGGFVHIKVDRPLSPAEQQHRLGVVAKNLEKNEKWKSVYNRRSLERERAEYERLKAKFEGQ